MCGVVGPFGETILAWGCLMKLSLVDSKTKRAKSNRIRVELV